MPIISYATKLGLVPGRTNEKWGQKKGFLLKKGEFSGLEFFSALYYPAVRTGMHASGVGQGWAEGRNRFVARLIARLV